MHAVRAIEIYKNGPANEAFRFVDKNSQELRPDEVRINVECFGVNFADVLARQGLYPEAPPLPYVPGYEVVGEVTEIGDDVKSLAVGDHVVSGCAFGGYSSELVVPHIYVQKIPAKTDSTVALSLVTQGQTAVHSFEFATHVYPQDLVLIHAAAGGVGTLLVQLAKHRGCEIIGTCGSDEKVKFLESMGVHHVINYRKTDFAKEIKRRFHKRRVDVAFDSLGGHTLRKTLAMVGAGGRVVTLGIAEASGGKFAKLAMAVTALSSGFIQPTMLLAKSKSVAGVNLLKNLQHKPYIGQAAYRRAFELERQGVLKPVCAKPFDVTEIAEAHRLMEERNIIGKVSVHWH